MVSITLPIMIIISEIVKHDLDFIIWTCHATRPQAESKLILMFHLIHQQMCNLRLHLSDNNVGNLWVAFCSVLGLTKSLAFTLFRSHYLDPQWFCLHIWKTLVKPFVLDHLMWWSNYPALSIIILLLSAIEKREIKSIWYNPWKYKNSCM